MKLIFPVQTLDLKICSSKYFIYAEFVFLFEATRKEILGPSPMFKTRFSFHCPSSSIFQSYSIKQVGREEGQGRTASEKLTHVPETFTSYRDNSWQGSLDQRRKPLGDIFTLGRR